MFLSETFVKVNAPVTLPLVGTAHGLNKNLLAAPLIDLLSV
jgi:hypothetical protein